MEGKTQRARDAESDTKKERERGRDTKEQMKMSRENPSVELFGSLFFCQLL